MDLSTLQNLTEADKLALSAVSKTIRKERAIARAYKCRLDNIALSYQAQVSALTKERRQLLQDKKTTSTALLDSKVEEARKEVHEQLGQRISTLQDELLAAQASLQKAEAEKLASEKELSHSRQRAADDANLTLQLREEISQLLENKERAVMESVEKHARNMQLLRQSKESDSKVIKYEESNVFLKSEVSRLSKELVQTRTLLDSSNASHDAAITSANKTNLELSNNLAKSNIRAQKLANELSNVERHIIDMQADFDLEKSDQRAEIENLTQLVKMHRESAQDAEIKLAGYSEVLATLAKERKEAEERRPIQSARAVDKHAEVLFKDLNQALDAKLQMLERERHELIRSRAAEARMATTQQSLIREADAARRELDDTRQQVISLEAELGAQKDKVAQLERRLMFGGPTAPFQSPPVLPFADNPAPSFRMNTGASGQSGIMAAETPSPFRQASRLGNAEQALAGMVEIRRRHEALLEGLRDKRNEYGLLLNDR